MVTSILNPNEYRVESLFFSFEHTISLFILLFLCLFLFIFRNTKFMKHIRWILFFLLLLSEISINVWTIYYGNWSIRFNLPLQLCTVSIYLCSIMLLTKSYRIFEIVYFTGIGGAIQAIVTPDLFYTFPHFRFLHFFGAHIAIILSIFYMIWVYHYKVTFSSLIKSFFALNVLAFIAFSVNLHIESNYMFLASKPTGPSLLDLLGPYPYYILSLEVVAFIIYLLLYLPFYINEKWRM